MQLGKQVKQEDVDEALVKAGCLLEGEIVWAAIRINNLRPLVDLLIVTNLRLLAVMRGTGKVGFAVPHSRIASSEYDLKRGRVRVVTDDGVDIVFKASDREDAVTLVQRFLELGRDNSAPEGAAVAAESAYTTAKQEQSPAIAKIEQSPTAGDYGREIARDSFSGKTVAIYERGYVRVGGFFSLGSSQYERLVAIESSANITKKTAAGRAAGAMLTGGLNLLSPNQRGDAYLTIVTESNTYVLHEDSPSAMGMKSMKKLEGAGNGVLNTLVRGSIAHASMPVDEPPTSETPAPQDAAERLSSFAQLREQGLISDDEFQTLRARVLDSL